MPSMNFLVYKYWSHNMNLLTAEIKQKTFHHLPSVIKIEIFLTFQELQLNFTKKILTKEGSFNK
jgi:SPX domain protein involved in polyphosphate accumulation